MENELKNLEEQFNADFQAAGSNADLELLRVKYLGRNGSLNDLFAKMASFDKEQKAAWGKSLNNLKQKITTVLDEKLEGSVKSEEKIDLSFPAGSISKGSLHIITKVSRQICLIFEKMGFRVAEGNEIEDEWHNFTALNIPLDHPSRDAFDTFYLDIAGTRKYLLRSHTSPSQARVMKDNNPPLAVISPGRVYRPDAVDASHSFMFHQIEGFAVDANISFAHLKGVLLNFAKDFFSSDARLRFRPHFFPFTEPSAEADISCIFCRGKKEDKQSKCSVCKGKGWLEILGCGMIHPAVLRQCGINSQKYRGFAFGMGVERMVMLKYGINDIRLFYENDVRFLEQF